jgi:hypothetical protein
LPAAAVLLTRSASSSGEDVHQKGHDSHYRYHDGDNGDARDGDDHAVQVSHRIYN